jgi:hypothetical protein
LYGGFLVLALYRAVWLRDFGDAAMQLGIALAFDPFNPSVPWKQRPLYQRAWLITHLLLLGLSVLAAIYLS